MSGDPLAEARCRLESLMDGDSELEAMRKAKDGAYSERNQLVAALSKLFPASLERHPQEDTTWEDDWRWIVFIDLPTGQASWHLHDSELGQFDHLTRGDGCKWDGHTTEEKYARLAALPSGWCAGPKHKLHISASPGFHRYRSHKVVEAAEIKGTYNPADGEPAALLGDGLVHSLPAGIFARGVPEEGDFLVRYNAGTDKEYLSWSPRDVFIDGYTLIGEE